MAVQKGKKPSIEDLVGAAGGSTYKLVILAARRAMEISAGAPKLIETNIKEKASVIALEEIEAGKVYIKLKKESKAKPKAKPKAKK